MVTYNIKMDYIMYPELDNLSSYVSRSQSPAHIGRALGQIYLKLDGIPELPEYVNREMIELSQYHSDDLIKVKDHFQAEIFRILKDKPSDPSRIFFKAYINGTDRDRMLLRFGVDYGPDRNETIKITQDNIHEYFDLIFRFRQDRVRSYHDSESDVYSILPDDYYTQENLFPGVSRYDGIFPNSCRNFTFQVTESCNARCSYCYQGSKSNMTMDFPTACSAIDDLLAGKFEYLSPGFSKSIILDFIGGDPLLEIELIEQIYEYFLQETYRLNHPWFHHHRLSMCSNGLLYFNKKTKEFFDKYARMTSFNISIDGNKSLHDSCRIQPTGEGSYDIGIAGVLHAYNAYKIDISSKMTLAPSNIPYIKESVKNLCIDNPYPGINLNVVFEDVWSNHDAKVLYDQMKSIADMVIDYKRPDLYFSIFRTAPMLRKKESSSALTNICGGVGAMLAVAPDKNYYPCIRYMPSSLNGEARELIIGNTTSKMDKDTTILREFPRVTYMSQQNDRCLSCPVHHMCNWCFKADTTILTDQGLKYIQDINIGDNVVSHDGSINPVANVMKHMATNTLRIKAFGTPYIDTTGEHPFLVRRQRHSGPRIWYMEPEWMEAKDIKIGDRIALYKNNHGNINFDKDIAYIIGRWLGDGWVTHITTNGRNEDRYFICCNKNEEDELELMLQTANITFGKDNTDRTATEYRIHKNGERNQMLINILSQCGRYSHGKVIAPEIFNWDKNTVSSVLQGLYDADGYVYWEENLIKHTTVSKKLVIGIGILERSIGIFSTMYESDKNIKNPLIQGRLINARKCYTLEHMIDDSLRRYKTFEDDVQYTWGNVSKIKNVDPYEVYNMTVDNTHTYIADGSIVHNCSGLCYQINGTVNERTTFICEMIKAEYLASIYYWANLAIHYPEYHIQLDTELAPYYHFEQIVSKEEYNKLENMIWQYYLDEYGEVDEDRIARTLAFMQMSAPLAEEVTYQSGTKPGMSGSYSGSDITFPLIVGLYGAQTDRIPGGSIRGMKAFCTEWGVNPGSSYTASGPYTDQPMLGYLIAGESNRKGAQFSIWSISGANYFPSQCISGGGGGDEYVYWKWSGGGQDFVTLDKITGKPPPKDPPEDGGECGTCNDTCTDSCSEAGDCKHNCLSNCNVLCDNSCDRVCISQCNDHCAPTCRLACSGCDNYCTACNWSCQNECIVTCQGECAACRQNCKNLGMSNTECKLLCRACTTMCIMNCTQSCITWNSGGSVSAKIRSNATLNDWQGFTSNNAPRDGGSHLSHGGGHAYNWSIGPVNLWPRKTNVPHGYGLTYNGETPTSGSGSINGERGDWDSGAIKGEEAWYHNNDTDVNRGQHDFTQDLDYDKKKGL